MSDRDAIDRLVRQLHPGAPAGATLPAVRQEARTFVAADGDRVIGLIAATFVDYGLEAYGTIEELVTDEEHRGRRAGTALLEKCRAWFEDLGATVVFVSALEDAESFYRKNGFTPCTGAWLYWTPGSEEAPA